jgi:hypothetical protein
MEEVLYSYIGKLPTSSTPMEIIMFTNAVKTNVIQHLNVKAHNC